MNLKMNRATALLALTMLIGAVAPARAADVASPVAVPGKTETVVFAGGCFWGVQSVFQHTKGVVTATSGYAGGNVDKPDYGQVGSGRTGHAESVRVTFDPAQVSYQQLLRIFFSVAHDPTLLNRQGPDVGTQYRSAVFYTTDAQKQATDAFIDQLNKSHVYARPIVTQVSAAGKFWIAEPYHQNYADLHPDEPYIAINDAPKVVNLRRQFPALYSDKLAAHE
jgi:peptide-methionine (S)-S-oxide reductase